MSLRVAQRPHEASPFHSYPDSAGCAAPETAPAPSSPPPPPAHADTLRVAPAACPPAPPADRLGTQTAAGWKWPLEKLFTRRWRTRAFMKQSRADAGTEVCRSNGAESPFLGLRLPAGLLLSLLSFAFWRLDRRNRELITAAEVALREFEDRGRVDGDDREAPVVWLFTREQRQSEKRKAATGWRSFVIPHTYSHVFNVLFCSFLVAGLLIAILAVW